MSNSIISLKKISIRTFEYLKCQSIRFAQRICKPGDGLCFLFQCINRGNTCEGRLLLDPMGILPQTVNMLTYSRGEAHLFVHFPPCMVKVYIGIELFHVKIKRL